MESRASDSSSNQAELNSLLSQFQTSIQNAKQISSFLRKQDYWELRACNNLPNPVLIAFSAAFCAISNIKVLPFTTATLRPKVIEINDLSQVVKSFDILNLHLNNDQITFIQNIYSNNSGLTNQLRAFSTFAYRLSEWVEVYVDISIKGNRIKELKRILGIN